MKKIGFIDYMLDEWHAHQYPDWIRGNAAKSGRGCDVAYAWADKEAPGGMSTSAWCEKYGVQALPSLEELVEKSDYLVVLSPDNPEHHERLGRLALMSGKPVYMDKTFSPDLPAGIRMFELADKYGTPIFSSSALRFAKELQDRPDKEAPEAVATTGPGEFANYAVHQLEMIVSLMGVGAKRIKSLSSAHQRLFAVDYADGRQATMLQMPQAPFQAALQFGSGQGEFHAVCTDFFEQLIEEMLHFFESSIPPVPSAQTLEIMALIDAGREALAHRDTWVQVER